MTSSSMTWATTRLINIAAQKKYALNCGPFGSKLVSRDYKPHGVPVIRGINLSRESSFSLENFVFVSEKKADELFPNNAHPGDLIFTQRGTLGQIGLIPKQGVYKRFVVSQSQMKLTVDEAKADPYFIYCFFCLSSTIQTIHNLAISSGVPHINLDILRKFEVPLPPLPIQRKIAAIISNYDRLIENNTRRIEILEEMARSLYDEWFVKFRFPGHEQVKMVDSELGLIPEGWEAKSVGNMLSYHIGGGWGEEEQSSQYRVAAYVIRGTDIPSARQVSVDNCPLRFHKQSNFNSRKIEVGDIVFEVSGGSKGQPVGRALLTSHKLINAFDEDVICASFCKLLRVNREIILPELLYLHLLDIYSDGRIDKYQVQSTGITNFKFAFFLESELITVPTPQWQARFSEIAIPIFKSIQTLGAKNYNLRRTRDLLLPKLISGEIDVENLDIETEVTA